MARYLYNGQNYPAPPSAWDKSAYPIAYISISAGYAYFKVFDKLGYLELLDTGYYRYTLGSLVGDEDAQTILCSTWKESADGTEWELQSTDRSSVGFAADLGPIWANETIYYEDGTVAIEGSEPVLVEETEEATELTFEMGIAVGMSLKGKSGGTSTRYVVGDPVTFTLAADSWNGSMYTLYAYLYAVGDNGVQIGLPSGTSTPNAQDVIEAALTVHSTYVYAGSTTAQPYTRLYIVAVEPPTEDIEIAIFGLTPVDDTVTATASEEETE